MKLFLLVIFIVFFGAFSINNAYNSPTAKFSKLLESCKNKADFASCFRGGLKPMVSTDSLRQVVRLLEDRVPACHPEAHILGEVAIENNIEFSDVAEICGTGCNYGCVHGAFTKAYSGRLDSSFDAKDVCKNFGDRSDFELSCTHAVGHALAETFNKNPDEAFGKCKSFGDDPLYMSCANGLLMQTFLGSSGKPLVEIKKEQDLLTYCSQRHSAYRDACFSYLGYYGYHFFAATESDVCSRVPHASKQLCVYSLGERAFKDFRYDPDSFYEFCKQFGDLNTSCIDGALEAYKAEGKDTVFGKLIR